MIANFGRLALVVVVTTIPIAAPAAPAASAEATQPAVPAPEASVLTFEPIAEQAGVCSPTAAATADLFEQAAGQGDQHRKGCPPGIRSCPASQVGQLCDPNNPALICSAQANGAYCCLAYAGAADAFETQPAGIAAAGGGRGPCCTHQDRTSCAASCQAAGCADSIAACINLRCSCRCFGCSF